VIPAEYRLLFGISNAFPNLPVGIDQRVAHKGFAFLTVQCSGGRCGWFFFQKLEERVCVPNIPRYSQKDAEAMVQPYMDYSITERVKFRDLWDNRIVSGLVPLEEYLAEKWTWNRIVCVGDAIRKVCGIPHGGILACMPK
jgi:salicylate hydroxylase/FAD dependent monooxygenase